MTEPIYNHYTLAQREAGNPVPIVAENVGPFPSLEAALAEWPGFHEATDDEVHAYEQYWEAWYVINDPGNASGTMDRPTAEGILSAIETQRAHAEEAS